MTRDVRQPAAGPEWSELAALDGYAAVLDPGDRVGAKNRLIDRVHKRALSKVLPELAGLRVVDFGCGTGRLSEWLAAGGATVNGVDATAEMVERAREAVPSASFHVINGFDLPFEPGSQDVVISVGVLVLYVADSDAISALLAEFRRVLKPGGMLVAIEHTTNGDIGRGAPMARYLEVLGGAGYGHVSTVPVRIGDSRFVRWVERWPSLHDLQILPTLMMREARGTPASALVGERYADTLIVGRTPTT